MARGWRNDSSRRRRSWDLGFEYQRHCERSEAIHASTMDCFATLALTRRIDMHHITLDGETDFGGWRKAARALALNNVKPSDVTWNIAGDAPELFAPTPTPLEPSEGTFNVSAKSVELAQIAILHRSPERFALLYRLLWRLRGNHDLLDIATDPDVAELSAMAQAVRRDAHKMHAFVRFRE